MTDGGRTKSFPLTYWDPTWRAYLHLNEFGATDWKARLRIPPWIDSQTPAELEDLRRLKREERDKHLDDIKAQADSVFPYLFRMLLMGPISHPQTFQLMHSAILVGRSAVMHFKNVHNRPRPTQYAPDLQPPIDVPGHPAYPSGHSTQLHLIAMSVGVVIPDAGDSLMDFAWDVAVNRERAGLHYRSDSEMGRDLARQMFNIMTECKEYGRTLDQARKEWP